MKNFAYWLILILWFGIFAVYGTQYAIDIANIGALKIEVRSATQSAATYAFQELSLEGVAERKQQPDRAHRTVILNNVLARQRFESALKANLGLESDWHTKTNKYLRKGGAVTLLDLQIIDSTILPYTYNGRTFNEPTVYVVLQLPTKSYMFKQDYIEVTRVIPFRTFITNWQKN